MIIENNSSLENSLARMFSVNNNNSDAEIARLASLPHRDVSYRRNGMLNFGSKQLTSFVPSEFYRIGMGGTPTVG